MSRRISRASISRLMATIGTNYRLRWAANTREDDRLMGYFDEDQLQIELGRL